MVEATDLAWLAGVLDGEGCIGLYQRITKGKTNGWDYFVTIANTNATLLLKVFRIVEELCAGGKGRTTPYLRPDNHSKRYGPNWHPCWAVAVQNKRAIEKVLSAVRPYLANKAEQADAMLLAVRCKGPGAHGVDVAILRSVVTELKDLKNSHGDAEVTLRGLRFVAHRNEQAVSPNNNPPTSARHAAEVA